MGEAKGGRGEAAEGRTDIPAAVRAALSLPTLGRVFGGGLVSLPFLAAEASAGVALPGHPFILVLPAILAASVLFRWQGGLAALSATALYVDLAHLEPVGSLSIMTPAAAIAFLVFLGVGLYVIAVVSSLQASMARQARLLADVERARDRAAASEREKEVLIEELDHRIRNAIASVASVGRQTLRSAASLEDARESFEQRIAALTRTHDLIGRGGASGGAELRDILDGEFAPFAGEVRCELSGPDVRLGPRTALALSLVVHELATNAAKYGGLSQTGRAMRVAWRREGEGPLLLDWTEEVAEPIVPSGRRGSGSRLLDHTVAGLGGRVVRDPAPLGHRLAIALPWEALAA